MIKNTYVIVIDDSDIEQIDKERILSVINVRYPQTDFIELKENVYLLESGDTPTEIIDKIVRDADGEHLFLHHPEKIKFYIFSIAKSQYLAYPADSSLEKWV